MVMSSGSNSEGEQDFEHRLSECFRLIDEQWTVIIQLQAKVEADRILITRLYDALAEINPEISEYERSCIDFIASRYDREGDGLAKLLSQVETERKKEDTRIHCETVVDRFRNVALQDIEPPTDPASPFTVIPGGRQD